MSEFYDEMRDMSTELLTEFNQADYKLLRAGTPIPGPNDWDEPTPGTPTVFTPQGIGTAVDKGFVDGKDILTTDRQVLVAVFEDEPRPGDVFTVNGVVQTVLKIMPVTDMVMGWRIIVKA